MAVDKDKTRLKTLSKEQEAIRGGLTPRTREFINKLEVAYGENLYLTSGLRHAEDNVGTSSETSTHNHGEGFDFIESQKDVYLWANNSGEGLALQNEYGIAFYDETNPENRKKTGSKKSHFHGGTDPGTVKNMKARYKDYQEGKEIPPMFSWAHMYSDDAETLGGFTVESYNARLSKGKESEKGEIEDESLTDDIINTMAEQLKTEEKLNKENSERLALIEADNAEKVKKAELQAEEDKLQGILAMFDTMGEEQLIQPQQEIAERQVDESPIRLNRVSTENIFQSGYNG